MLNFIEKGSDDPAAVQCIEQFYSLTLECFQSTNNERLWLKTNIKLARLLLDRKQYHAVARKLRELHRACQKKDGSDDPSKGTYSLEIYAKNLNNSDGKTSLDYNGNVPLGLADAGVIRPRTIGITLGAGF